MIGFVILGAVFALVAVLSLVAVALLLDRRRGEHDAAHQETGPAQLP